MSEFVEFKPTSEDLIVPHKESIPIIDTKVNKSVNHGVEKQDDLYEVDWNQPMSELWNDNSLPRTIRKCYFTDKECYESTVNRIRCEMYNVSREDGCISEPSHECYKLTVGVLNNETTHDI